MKTKIIVLTATLLMLAVGLVSCEKLDEFFGSSKKNNTKKENEIVTDPAKAIIGKWEQTEIYAHLQLEPDPQPYKPTGYFEFRQDSTVVWYDYATKEYTYEAKYWIEAEPIDYVGPIFNPMNGKTVWFLSFRADPDKNQVFNYIIDQFIVFYSNNRMGLTIANVFSQNPHTEIYSRKN